MGGAQGPAAAPDAARAGLDERFAVVETALADFSAIATGQRISQVVILFSAVDGGAAARTHSNLDRGNALAVMRAVVRQLEGEDKISAAAAAVAKRQE